MTGVTGWTVGGVDVRTMGINLESVHGWDGFPRLRGASVLVPNRHGRHHHPDAKAFYDEVRFPLRVLVLPVDPVTGTVTHPNGGPGHIDANVETFLAALHPADGGLVEIGRTYADGSTWTIGAKVLTGFRFSEFRKLARRGSVTFTVPVPFWKSDTPDFDAEAYTSDHGYTIDNTASTAPVPDPVVTFTATTNLVDPRITIAGAYVEIAGTISAGDNVVVDVGAGTVLENGSVDRLADLRISRPWLLELPPGTVNVDIQATSGTGTFRVDWSPRRF